MDIGQLSNVYRCETSFNGYSLDELKSALQKYIRRSDPVMAIYAGLELDLFALIGAEGVRTNFLHRLMVIYMEDVGNFALWPWMDKMMFELLSLRKRRNDLPDRYEVCRKSEMGLVPRIINVLATSSHSRENSFYNFVYNKYFAQPADIKARIKSRYSFMNDVERAADMTYPTRLPLTADLTAEQIVICRNFLGCIESRNEMAFYFAHKINQFPKLTQKFYKSTNPAFLIFHLIEKACPMFSARVDLAVRWFKELSPLQEDYLCWHHLLLMIVKDRRTEPFAEDMTNVDRMHLLYKRNIRKTKVEFDDFVYDMHTRKGKLARRSGTHFATVSSVVTNEDPEINLQFKNIYTYFKLITDSVQLYSEPELESDFFRFQVRAQLVTGNGKTDTYFATRPDGQLVFVKGPFDSNYTVDKFVKVQLLKKKMDLHTLDYDVVYLKPDLFPDSPLGLRHKLNNARRYPFIMCKPVFDFTAETIPRRSHSSKVWPATEVVDWSMIPTSSHLSADVLDDPLMMKEFVENVVFRYVFGIGDLAKRNFLVHDGHILAIDEDSWDKDFSLEENIRDLYKPFLGFIQENKEWFVSVLCKFEEYRNHRLEFLEKL
jgi:hypothetical protein